MSVTASYGFRFMSYKASGASDLYRKFDSLLIRHLRPSPPFSMKVFGLPMIDAGQPVGGENRDSCTTAPLYIELNLTVR
jgi:hypothetical protein